MGIIVTMTQAVLSHVVSDYTCLLLTIDLITFSYRWVTNKAQYWPYYIRQKHPLTTFYISNIMSLSLIIHFRCVSTLSMSTIIITHKYVTVPFCLSTWKYALSFTQVLMSPSGTYNFSNEIFYFKVWNYPYFCFSTKCINVNIKNMAKLFL